MGFVLSKERQHFYQTFASKINRAVNKAPGIHGSAKIVYASSQSPSDFASLMTGLQGKIDVLGATAVSHHDVTQVVEKLQTGGVPCFAMFNDFAQGVRQSYLGLNNLKVGRIAASMIATTVHIPGPVAVFVGGHRWHGHELRETGFRSYFREYAPQFNVLDTMVNLENRQLTYEATLDLLARRPDLRAIYVAGGGMEGAIAALREVRAPGQVALVVNELTPQSRAGLQDRFVTLAISTPLRDFCDQIVSLMTEAADEGVRDIRDQRFLQPDLYLPESV